MSSPKKTKPSSSANCGSGSSGESSSSADLVTDSSQYEAVVAKNSNKLTPKDKVILEGHSLLYHLKSTPHPGTIVYAKPKGSVYWPALTRAHDDEDMPEASQLVIVFYLEDSYRVGAVDMNKVIPFVRDDKQRELIEKLNRTEKAPLVGNQRAAWIKSYNLALEFHAIDLSERMVEQERRFNVYKEIKKQKQRERKNSGHKNNKTSAPSTSDAKNSAVVSNERQNRKSEHYELRPAISVPKMDISLDRRSESRFEDDEAHSTSATALAKPRKVDSKPKDDTEMEEYVKHKFENMDKLYTPDFVTSAICSACGEQAEDDVVCCHDMPFHGRCIKMIAVPGVERGQPQCSDCELKRCFVCKSVESPSETKPIKCSKCELHFHISCLIDQWPQAIIQGSNGPITCPTHFCHICIFDHKLNGTVRNFTTSKPKPNQKTKSNNFVRCILCLATYHKSTCIPAGLGSPLMCGEYIICPKHTEKYPVDTKKCRKIGCMACNKKVKDKDEAVVCSLCPRIWHKGCAGTPPDAELANSFMCESCTWGKFPLHGEVVWFQQPGSTFWPGIILYQEDNKHRSSNSRLHPTNFSILYCGPKPQYYDNCHITRCLPLLAGEQELYKQLNFLAKPASFQAYREALVLSTLSGDYLRSQLPKAKPLYRAVDKNQYRIKFTKNKEGDEGEKCSCGTNKTALKVCDDESGCYNRSMSVECSEANCTGQDRCANRFFSKKGEFESALIHFEKDGMGWGLKCKKDIPKGSYIIEYTGEIISCQEKNRRLSLHNLNDHLYILVLENPHTFIDAEYYGNKSRLMNHSCSANCKSEKYNSASGKPVIGIFALRDIPKGEELTFNYRYQSNKSMKLCRCGADNCISLQLPANKQKENKVPLFDPSTWDNQCGVCQLDGDQLLMCDYSGCRKVYHCACVGLSKLPRGKYYCPIHTAITPSSKSRPKNQDVQEVSEHPSVKHMDDKPKLLVIPAEKGADAKAFTKRPGRQLTRIPKRSASISPEANSAHRIPLLDSNPGNQTLACASLDAKPPEMGARQNELESEESNDTMLATECPTVDKLKLTTGISILTNGIPPEQFYGVKPEIMQNGIQHHNPQGSMSIQDPPQKSKRTKSTIVEDPPQKPKKTKSIIVNDPPQKLVRSKSMIVKDPPQKLKRSKSMIVKDPPQKLKRSKSMIVKDPPQKLTRSKSMIFKDPPEKLTRSKSMIVKDPLQKLTRSKSMIVKDPPEKLTRSKSMIVKDPPQKLTRSKSMSFLVPDRRTRSSGLQLGEFTSVTGSSFRKKK